MGGHDFSRVAECFNFVIPSRPELRLRGESSEWAERVEGANEEPGVTEFSAAC
jgi:hypothetical protein